MIREAPILVYHQVLPRREPGGPRGVVLAATFERQMRYLAGGGCSTWTMAEVLHALEARLPAPGRAVALTFDDATADHWSFVFPVLARYGLKATFFVPTGAIADGPCRPSLAEVWEGRAVLADLPTRGHMRWSELERVARGGRVELESHGHAHLRCPAEGSDVAARKRLSVDLRASRMELERRLGRPSRVLAWPHGATTAAAQRVAHAVGFRLTLATSTPRAVADDRLLYRRHFGEDYDGPLREPVHYWRFVQTIESSHHVGRRWRLVRALAALSRRVRSRCCAGDAA